MRLTSFFPLLLGLFLLAPALPAQAPTADLPDPTRTETDAVGASRLYGMVLDADEAPLEGAEIRVWRAGRHEETVAAKSDAKGRYMLQRLGAGVWRLMVVAPDHHAALGMAVLSSGAGEKIDVTLRSLQEVRTRGAESPRQITFWLERGNDLLRQGFPAEARREYESALAALPVEGQGEVLRTIAHTYYLEQNLEEADLAVRRALLRDPQDDLARRLLLSLAADRSQETQAWLRRLDAEGPEALAEEIEMPAPGGLFQMPPLPEAVVVAPEAGRTGSYRTSFTRRSPLSELDVFLDRHGLRRNEVTASDPQAAKYRLEDESYELIVPESYDADDAEPWGVMVWVSPTPWGGLFPSERLGDRWAVLERERVLWIGANDSGNARPSWDRIGLALDAAQNIQDLYNIDPERIYAGGYSGGGRLATALAVLYPEVFRGALLAFGCNYYRETKIPDQPGSVWPAAFPPPSRKALKHLRGATRLAFLTGEFDFNRPQTRVYHRLYQDDGFRFAEYLEIPDGNHYSGLPAEWLERVIQTLDGPLKSPTP